MDSKDQKVKREIKKAGDSIRVKPGLKAIQKKIAEKGK